MSYFVGYINKAKKSWHLGKAFKSKANEENL